MRPFEYLIGSLVLVRLLGAAAPGLYRARELHCLPLVALGLIPVHLLVEGYRWQMLPLYLLAALLGFVSGIYLWRGRRAARPSRLASGVSWLGWGLTLLTFLPAAALPIVLSVPRLPEPTGPYPVGTQSFVLTDPDRPEIFSETPGELRRIMIQVWYPADPQPNAERALWLERVDLAGPAIARTLDLPSFFLDHLALARTNAFLNAPVAAGTETFPVLLFSHGWTGFRAQNTHQMEELASHGYVVIALEHPYGSMVTVFPDGTVVETNPRAIRGESANQLVRQWAGDMAFVLDQLTPLQAGGPAQIASGRADLERVGVFGHSTGGGAGIEFCARDARCQAYLGLDAYLAPVSPEILSEQGFDQPALFLYSQFWRNASGDPRFNQLRQHLRADVRAFELLGTDHYDFTDLPMLSPLAAQFGLKGPLPGPRVVAIIDGYTLAFFDRYLKGRPVELPTFPEARER